MTRFLANPYLYLPGVSGSVASTPDSNALDITGDIDLRARVSSTVWRNQTACFIAKWSSPVSYAFRVNTGGTLALFLSNDGIATPSASSTASVAPAAGDTLWVRATWRASDGRVQFFTAPGTIVNPVAADFVQLGADQTIAIASINIGTALVAFGALTNTGSSQNWNGNYYRAQIRNGIDGTLVLDADFTAAPLGSTTFTESSSNAATITINQTGTNPAILRNPRRLLQPGVYLPGATGSYVQTSTATNLTSYNVLVYTVKAGFTAGISSGAITWLINRHLQGGFGLQSGSLLMSSFTLDGSAYFGPTSGTAVNLEMTPWLRMTRNATTGNILYEKSVDGSAWTTVSSHASTAGALNPSPTSGYEVGSVNNGTAYNFGGWFERATVTGDGTTLFDANFGIQTNGATSFTESSSAARTVTLTGQARLVTARALANSRGPNVPRMRLTSSGVDSAQTPHSTPLNISGDIDLRVRVQFYTGQFIFGGDVPLIWKTYGNGWYFMFGATGQLNFSLTAIGAATSSTYTLTAADAAVPTWYRVTRVVSTGQVIFYKSVNNVDWTTLTTTTLAATTALPTNAFPLGIGQFRNIDVYNAQVYSGVNGTKVFDADFTKQAVGATSFTESANGATVTLNSTKITLPVRPPAAGLWMPGIASNYASVPDSAPLKITGDIDIRCYVKLDSWTSPVINRLVTKGSATRNYDFYIANNTGYLGFFSATSSTKESGVGTGFLPGTAHWVRVTRATATGTVTFYTSEDGVNWVLLAANGPGNAGALTTTTDIVTIGVYNDGSTHPLSGTIYRTQIYNGIAGTLALDANFSAQPRRTTSFAESANGATVTVNSTGSNPAQIV